MLADGGEAIADLALLRDQAEVFGPVASSPHRMATAGGHRSGRTRCSARGPCHRPRDRLAASRREPEGNTGLTRRRTRTARPGPGYRPRSGHLPLREGERGADLQTRLRVPPAAVVPRQHRRGPGPACCGPVTPRSTPPRTTSPCPTPRSPSSRRPPARLRVPIVRPSRGRLQRDPLREPHRNPLEIPPARLPEPRHRLRLLHSLARRGNLRPAQLRPDRTGAREGGAKARADRIRD
jgi:hypothetical protein